MTGPKNELERYLELTPRSCKMWEEAKGYLPGGETRGSVFWEPYSIYISRGEGCHVQDADGVDRLDFIGNMTTFVLGNAYPPVVDAVRDQAALGLAYNAPNEHQIRLARLLCQRVPSVELLRFTNSGTEATLMLPQNKPDRIRILFDDHRLVANAGLLLPATLARHLGLRELVDHHLDLGGAPGRANTGDKMLTLVASALAGGDCIDDADALRAGGTVGVLGCVVKAPSTLGTFLRSFRWGHVRQLDRVSRQLLARAWAAGAGPGDSPLTIDLDAPNEHQIRLARLLCQRVPSVELLKFTNSGTEATLNARVAIRAARAFTGNPLPLSSRRPSVSFGGFGFTNSGTEATLNAIRAARAFTGNQDSQM